MLLEARRVSKAYAQGGVWKPGGRVQAVQDVSLTLEAGECVALAGPSGSGKSTLGRLVLGLERPDSGAVLFGGQDLARLRGAEKKAARRAVQVVFQNSHGAVNPRCSALEVIAEPLIYAGAVRGGFKQAVAGLMERVGLAPADMDKLPHQFSGGELQRICLARALALSPAVIVLDEAVSSLDMLSQSRVLDVLADLRRTTDTALLFITHDLRVAGKIADRLAVMEAGQLVFDGSLRSGQLRLEASAHPAVHRLLESILPAGPIAW